MQPFAILPQCKRSTQVGMVLLSVTLVLFVIGTLAVAALESSQLELIVSRHFQDQLRSFEKAESMLVDGERATALNSLGKKTIDNVSFVTWKKIKTNFKEKIVNSTKCGVDYFQIDAFSSYRNAATHLISYFTRQSKIARACPPTRIVEKISLGRLNWLQSN